MNSITGALKSFCEVVPRILALIHSNCVVYSSCTFLTSIILTSVEIMSRGTARQAKDFSPSVRFRRTQSRLIGIGVLCAVLSFPFGVWGQTTAPATGSQDSQVKSAGTTQFDYGMPERLGRQVAPTPGTPWRSPDLSGYTSVLKSAERSPIDPQKRYELVDLIDLA